MMKNIFLLVCLIVVGFSGRAQYDGQRRNEREREWADDEKNVLSVFSEAGDQFFLILNGVNQNSTPRTFVRVEGLPQSENDIQILFTDGRTGDIRKHVTVMNPVDRKPVNLSMKIVRMPDGDARLKFNMCVPREFGYRPRQGEFVMNYGMEGQQNGGGQYQSQGGQYQQQGGGYDDGGQYKQTVTVTQTTVATPPPPPPPPPAPTAMDPQTFQAAKQTIAGASFDDTKMSTARTIATSNYFTTDQVIELCNLFSFDDSKLNFAKFAYSRTVDNNMYFRVNDVFSFDASKKALNDFVAGKH